jgi:hypothetical protein
MHQQSTHHGGGGPNSNSTRIPLALQSVFLNGNRGIVVNTPPPEKVASTTFRGWWGRRPLWTDFGTAKKSPHQLVGAEFSVETKAATKPKKKKKVSTSMSTYKEI